LFPLAKDGPADPYQRSAFLHGDLEIAGHAHREMSPVSGWELASQFIIDILIR